jgi:hypothetical protein
MIPQQRRSKQVLAIWKITGTDWTPLQADNSLKSIRCIDSRTGDLPRMEILCIALLELDLRRNHAITARELPKKPPKRVAHGSKEKTHAGEAWVS